MLTIMTFVRKKAKKCANEHKMYEQYFFYLILDLFLLYLCVVADGLFITVPSSSAVNTPEQPLPHLPLSCLRNREM